MPYHVYVSNSGSEWFSHFIMDENTGALEPQDNIALDGVPGAVATNAADTLLFLSLRSQQQLGSYAINQESGKLTKISGVSVQEGPPSLRTDNTDRYLLASYYGAGHVSVHQIADDGTLSEEPLQWIHTGQRAHSIQTDRSNRFAFVPHTMPTNAIFQFRFDQSSGTLTPNNPPKIQPDGPEGPRHFAFHPQKDLLYSINEDGSTVSAHHFDAQQGTLSSFQVISTLPEGFDGDNTTAEIAITPDGKYLYGSNRGHDSLALFDVGDDGTLTAKGHFATETTPRFFDLDPTGNFLYAVGQGSGRMASYQVDIASGVLEPMEVYDVDESPLWIQFVKQA